MMKNGFSGPFLILLLLSSTVSEKGSVVWRKYIYVQEHLNWQEAQSHCRSSSTIHHTDLATINTQSDEDSLHLKDYHAWIGLYRKQGGNFAWTNADSTSYTLPFKDEQQSQEICVTVHYSDLKYDVRSCETYYFFFCHSPHDTPYHYELVLQSKTWEEAHQYCKSKFTDLATFTSIQDIRKDVEEQVFQVWTGLHRDGETWRWSRGVSDFRNWAKDEPGNNGDCVSISSLKKEMATQNCSTRFPFVCLRDNLFLVKENKTWREALEHCRALWPHDNFNFRFELVSVQPEDHDHVTNRVKEADTEEVWVGLRFLAGHWVWVNGASMLYPDLPACPPVEQGCGVFSKNDMGKVENTDCTEKRNFLCYSSY
ncbi:hypothetical protein PBY51_019383 [Eleginops maclovinus]|uniref:C-type lectin domain-containing protein n=1 Tax=Eleginops maclovinus TaxID=56733 RepID=A0AAN8AY11_ELEMC|nr:hypothetical protein PBY51_019383 [Eleginops maclovinus]